MELVFGAATLDIGAASFIWFGCAGEPLGAFVAGCGSALTAGAAQKVAATISARSCWLFTNLQPNFLLWFAAELARHRGFDNKLSAR